MTSVNISELAATAPSAVVPSRETQAVSTTDSSGSASVPSSAGPAIALIFASSSFLFAAVAAAAIDVAASAASDAAALRRDAGDGRMPTSAAVCGSNHAAIKRWERCITTRRVAHLRVVLLHPETKHSVLPVLALGALFKRFSRHDSEPVRIMHA